MKACSVCGKDNTGWDADLCDKCAEETILKQKKYATSMRKQSKDGRVSWKHRPFTTRKKEWWEE